MEHTSQNPHLTLTLVRTPRDAADAHTAHEIETIDLLGGLDEDQRLANAPCVFCGELAETVDYGPMLLCDGIRKGEVCNQPWHTLCVGLRLRVPDGPWIGPCCRTAESDAETEPSAPIEAPRAAPSSRKRKRGQPPPPPPAPPSLASERLPPPSQVANIEWPPRGYAQVQELESGDEEAAAPAAAARPEWQRAADDANGTECDWPDEEEAVEEAVEEAAQEEEESADIPPPPVAPLAPPPPAALPAAPPPLPIAPAVSPVPPPEPEAAERSVEARFALLERLWDREFLSIEEYKTKREELLRLV